MPLPGTFLTVISDQESGLRIQDSGFRIQDSGVSPDEKIFTPTDERGFLPHTPHPTPHHPITPHPQNSLIFPTFAFLFPKIETRVNKFN